MERRTTAVADAIGSVRAEGLEPGDDVVALLDAWAAGQISATQMADAKRAVLAGRSVEQFLPVTAA